MGTSIEWQARAGGGLALAWKSIQMREEAVPNEVQVILNLQEKRAWGTSLWPGRRGFP